MRIIKAAFVATAIFSSSLANASEDFSVVTSIKPIHSLVSAIMDGVGTPSLIIEGAGSPHTYALKPSQAKALQDADLVFWVGPAIESFLKKPIKEVASSARVIALSEANGLIKIEFREGGNFDSHDDHDDHAKHDDHDDHAKHDDHDDHAKHDDHDDHAKHDDHDDHAKHDDHDDHAKHDDHDDHAKHDDHDDHAKHDDHDDHAKHDDHDDHAKHDDHDDHAKHDDHDDHAKHDGHDDHAKHDDHDDHAKHDNHDDHAKHDDHGQFDMHIWLDPKNAKTIVNAIEKALIKADPHNIEAYRANALSMKAQLDKLITAVDVELNPVKGKPYVVFHDAYQYFESRFGMNSVGSITVSPEVLPGAKRIKELREKIKSLNATCVFSEPQFEPKLVATVIENTSAGAGVLDPLGVSINAGPDMYFTLIRNLSKSLKKCLQRGN